MSVPFRILRVLVFVAGLLCVFGPSTYFAGPTVEGLLFPIIKMLSRSEAVTAADGKVCWTTWMEKIRDAVPAYALYTTSINGRPVSIFVTTGAGVPLTQKGFANHSAGDIWPTTYCTVLPEQLRDRPRDISGMLNYQVPCDEREDPTCKPRWWRWRPSWWLVPQPLPTLVLPAD